MSRVRRQDSIKCCYLGSYEKSNEITAIPALIERLDLKGALVSTDAMGCQTTIAQSTLDAGADYLLAVKDNQPTLHAEIESYFATAPAAEVEKVETIDKDHGRFEVRNYSVSHQVDWYAAERSYPGAPRFPHLTTIAMVESRIERGDKIESERRSYISSRALSATAFAAAARGHWAIENKLHWVLDVTFGEDLSRLRTGHGAKTWRWYATSPSIWSAKSPTSDQSSAAASAPPGTRNTCWTLSARCSQSRVNLDSLPWRGAVLAKPCHRLRMDARGLHTDPQGWGHGH